MRDPNALALVNELVGRLKPPHRRTHRQFAEQEIIIPTGPAAGLRFSCDRHPVAGLLFDELDSGRWSRAFIVAINQDGKTLMGFIIPLLYVLFELRESVVVGVPSKDMVVDKWVNDLLPAIEQTAYARLLPESGAGSRGGEALSIKFRHGPVLRFMTGGGDDQSRAGFTARHLRVTEADGFDEVGSSSREGTKFAQLERRLLVYGSQSTTIAECTATLETGRVWHEYQSGTRSRIVLPCPHCGEFVTPEREHLVGWQDSKTETEAMRRSAIACPSCGALWSNQQRIEANHYGRLVHRGQSIDKAGNISGPLPETMTLGFRWTCVNSILNPDRVTMVGVKEFNAKHAADTDAADTDVAQSEWAIPAKPPEETASEITAKRLIARVRPNTFKGSVPPETQFITVGGDIGKWKIHWTAIAWLPGATPHILDYGIEQVHSEAFAEEEAVKMALRKLVDENKNRWVRDDGKAVPPTFTLFDCGWNQNAILEVIDEFDDSVLPSKGIGVSQERNAYTKRESGTKVLNIGETEQYAIIRLPDEHVIVEVQVDHWKTWVHKRAETPMDKTGALTLYEGGDHHAFAREMSAERMMWRHDAARGRVSFWTNQTRRKNHHGDSTVLACVGGHLAGARLGDHQAQEPPPPVEEAHEPETPAPNFITSYHGKY